METTGEFSRRQPFGESGDLTDIVLAVLSLSSALHGKSKVRITDFYRVFPELQERYPKLIPDLGLSSKSDYSKILGQAMENALCLGVAVANPFFQYFEVPTEAVDLILQRLRHRTGDAFVDGLAAAAAEFVSKLDQLQVSS